MSPLLLAMSCAAGWVELDLAEVAEVAEEVTELAEPGSVWLVSDVPP